MKAHLPFGGRHPRTEEHARSCPECASALRRERQYLARLRDAPIPPASEDLNARLSLIRELADQPVPEQRPEPRRAIRVAALAAGGTIATAGVLAAGAFVGAGDVLQPGTPGSAALSQVSAQTPADGRTLGAERLSRLRSEGWVCPELEAMGFHLETAKATIVEGGPAVELSLSDGEHYATVTERRTGPGNAAATRSGQTTQQDGGAVVSGTSPWSATYRLPGRTFTFVSDLPAEQADDALPILQRLSERAAAGVAASASAPHATGDGEAVLDRLHRGVARLAALFGPAR